MPRDTEIGIDRARSIIERLSPACFADARTIAEGWDVYYLADRFGSWWVGTGKPPPRNADALFKRFCVTWQKKNGRPN